MTSSNRSELPDLIKNQIDEFEVVSSLFKEQHLEHLRQQQEADLAGRVNDRLLIRVANEKQVRDSLQSLRGRVARLEQESVVTSSSPHSGGVVTSSSSHSGRWRCSVMSCKLREHQHKYPFWDGNRHIFFWDCCLSDDRASDKCDLDSFFGDDLSDW